MAQQCFDNVVAQVIHKYASILLLLLFGIASWWVSGIDSKVTAIAHGQAQTASKIEGIKQLESDLITLRVQFGELGTINATLKSHETTLRRIESRLDTLINRRDTFKEPY